MNGVALASRDQPARESSSASARSTTTLRLYDMGPCLYDPALGRFLEVDPVEGGSCNDYDYVCGDPINGFDLDGTFLERHSQGKPVAQKCDPPLKAVAGLLSGLWLPASAARAVTGDARGAVKRAAGIDTGTGVGLQELGKQLIRLPQHAAEITTRVGLQAGRVLVAVTSAPVAIVAGIVEVQCRGDVGYGLSTTRSPMSSEEYLSRQNRR